MASPEADNCSHHGQGESGNDAAPNETPPAAGSGQQQLAQTLKTHHKVLRDAACAAAAAGRDPQEVWVKHLEDRKALETYAQAMSQLATQHWQPTTGSRIQWCRDTVRSYFHGDGLSKALAKDARRLAHRRAQEPASSLPPPEAEVSEAAEKSAGPVGESAAQSKALCRDEDELPAKRMKGIPLRLLDVGSCYDPFSQFAEFDATAVDIAPANARVHKMDILTANIGVPPASQQESRAEAPGTQAAPILTAASFDVVVFSLLLSYMPTAGLRFTACSQARKLLRDHGLLVIMAPDSNHVGKGAKWMKSWKTAIESLGFRRCKYEKLANLHCMAFRAVPPEQAVEQPSQLHGEKEAAEMMTIPQDNGGRV